MKTFKNMPWTCAFCGEVMDAMTNSTGDSLPEDGDFNICMDCGSLYILRGQSWQAATDGEIAELPEDVLKDLARVEAARQMAAETKANDKSGRQPPKK